MRAIGIHNPGSRNKTSHLAAENDLLSIRRVESPDTLPKIAGEYFSLSTAVGRDCRNHRGAKSGQAGKNDALSIRRPTWPKRTVIIGYLTKATSIHVDDEQIRTFTSVVIEDNLMAIGRNTRCQQVIIGRRKIRDLTQVRAVRGQSSE